MLMQGTDRQRLSLAHEIGHLVMDTSAIADSKIEEKLAYRFAAALLVPADHARKELGNSRSRLEWGEIGVLKRKYGFSISAWIRRAYDLAIISEHYYKDLNIGISQRGWRKKEPIEYRGDEEPVRLKQMAQRAVSEGLMSPDRISRVGADILKQDASEVSQKQFSVHDLLAMPDDQRQAAMEAAFALAAEEDFEIFEANEIHNEAHDDEVFAETE